ncbi:hypothetical protein M440DRAFT_1068090 [Trichoderma longibrachiatum ATCC 18648]|uniref:Uncharacterized protein n=1 Tax=Trichoderma longibrachiatum ATCC 18648 TaxID=983965 RepID=A0A2T4BWJ6_TRILO|nr:hypothetical protein M440DRAFT_1068090 [Trichoderma longibrachiatum ATCC 18648]
MQFLGLFGFPPCRDAESRQLNGGRNPAKGPRQQGIALIVVTRQWFIRPLAKVRRIKPRLALAVDASRLFSHLKSHPPGGLIPQTGNVSPHGKPPLSRLILLWFSAMLDRSQNDGHSLTRSNILPLSNTSCRRRVTQKKKLQGVEAAHHTYRQT